MIKKPLVLYVENQIYHTHIDLLKTDFELVIVGSAKEADDLLKKRRFDGVILDIMMDADNEKLDPSYLGVPAYFAGLTILDRIITGNYTDYGNDRDLPVVVVSGVALVEVIRKIRNLVGQCPEGHYFMKPADFDEVANVLRNAINIRR